MLETARIPVHCFMCLCPSVNCKWSSVCIKQNGIQHLLAFWCYPSFLVVIFDMVLTSFPSQQPKVCLEHCYYSSHKVPNLGASDGGLTWYRNCSMACLTYWNEREARTEHPCHSISSFGRISIGSTIQVALENTAQSWKWVCFLPWGHY